MPAPPLRLKPRPRPAPSFPHLKLLPSALAPPSTLSIYLQSRPLPGGPTRREGFWEEAGNNMADGEEP